MGKRCEKCGIEFEPKVVWQRFCSRKCQNAGIQCKKQYKCQECGKIFYPKRPDRLKYCSRECFFKHHIEEGKSYPYCKVDFINCPICGKLFCSYKNRKVRCSKECDLEYGRIKGKKYYNSFRSAQIVNNYIEKTCKQCGKKFNINKWIDKTELCSCKCSKKFWKRQYRSIRKNQFIESISLNEVYLRDGGKCQICKKRVNRRLIPPHKMSAVLDHIIPLSKGGLHEYKNIQLAHFICNSYKCGKLVGQLRMFG